jgi:hypothetical protein
MSVLKSRGGCMDAITYVNGDATEPEGDGPKLIIHVCNDIGIWGAGFVRALSAKWSLPERAYRDWYDRANPADAPFELGQIGIVYVGEDLFVANMIAQHGTGPTAEGPPIRYDAVEDCLAKVADWCVDMKASVHAPRFGCGLAGGTWPEIQWRLLKWVGNRGIPITIYDL